MLRFALPLCCAVLLSSTAHAEEREWVSYKKLIQTSRLDKFFSAPLALRDKLTMFIALEPVNRRLRSADLNLTVLHDGQRNPLPLQPDGRLYLVPNQAWINDDATVLINQPAGEMMRMDFGMNVRLPAGRQWHYGALMGSVQQANELIRVQTGALSMFVPTLKSVNFRFAKPAQLVIHSQQGVKVYHTDPNLAIRLAPEAALLKENPLMMASEQPLEAQLDEGA